LLGGLAEFTLFFVYSLPSILNEMCIPVPGAHAFLMVQSFLKAHFTSLYGNVCAGGSGIRKSLSEFMLGNCDAAMERESPHLPATNFLLRSRDKFGRKAF